MHLGFDLKTFDLNLMFLQYMIPLQSPLVDPELPSLCQSCYHQSMAKEIFFLMMPEFLFFDHFLSFEYF